MTICNIYIEKKNLSSASYEKLNKKKHTHSVTTMTKGPAWTPSLTIRSISVVLTVVPPDTTAVVLADARSTCTTATVLTAAPLVVVLVVVAVVLVVVSVVVVVVMVALVETAAVVLLVVVLVVIVVAAVVFAAQLISTVSHQRLTHIRSSHGIPSVFKSLSPLLLGCLLHDHFELLKKP